MREKQKLLPLVSRRLGALAPAFPDFDSDVVSGISYQAAFEVLLGIVSMLKLPLTGNQFPEKRKWIMSFTVGKREHRCQPLSATA